MKNISLILSTFAVLFTACETDFDVNAKWEETTVVYGLLDASTDTQYVRINKAFLGEMDALQMAQYSDSINFSIDELDVKIYKWDYNQLIDTVALDAVYTIRDGVIFNDTIVVYEFINDNFLQQGFEYELLVKNNKTGNLVNSKTVIVSGFDFDGQFTATGNGRPTFPFGLYNNGDYSSSTITWDDSYDNGTIYQLDLIFNYTELKNGEYINKSLTYSLPLVDDSESGITIEGNKFFNFLALETNLSYDESVQRTFNGIDMLMTIGSKDLQTYINVNKPINGIVQQKPQFSNINNGIGLFSSRFSKIIYNYNMTSSSLDFLKSVDGLDRNFQ